MDGRKVHCPSRLNTEACSTDASIKRAHHKLDYVRARIAAYQKEYGKQLEKYTFDDDGTGQTEVRRLESEIEVLMNEEEGLETAIHRLRIVKKLLKDQASKKHGQAI